MAISPSLQAPPGTVEARAEPSLAPAAQLAPPLLFGALFCGLTLMGGRLLADPDTQWHVAVGRRIWQDGAVPWTDGFSHSFAGAPWIAKEWLSQLILFGAEAAGGWRGLAALAALALAGLLALLLGWLERRLRATVALAMTLAAILFLAPHALARPHVLALLPLFGWTAGLVRAAESRQPPAWWLLGLLALWVNLHGSFPVAYPIAAALAAEAVWSAPPGGRWLTARSWAAFLALAVAAGCASPYGIHAIGVTATMFGSGESLPFVAEWRPLRMDGVGLAALASAAAVALALATSPERFPFRLLLVLALTAAMLRHGRFLDIYAVVAPMLAAGPLARRFAFLRPEEIGRTGGARMARRAWIGALAAALLALAATPSPAPDPSVTPADALAAARRLGLTGPVYNDYDFGGFLIREGVPTFIDGRTDQLFLGGFISSLQGAIHGESTGPFLAVLARYGVEWALVRPRSGEARHLDGAAPGWERVFADETASVYRRR